MQNIKTKKKKWMVPALLLAVLLPVGLSAQGLFKRGIADEDYYGLGGTQGLIQNRGEATGFFTNENFGNYIQGEDITNETFGTPLTSGALILLAASAGYATIKTRKRNKKN